MARFYKSDEEEQEAISEMSDAEFERYSKRRESKPQSKQVNTQPVKVNKVTSANTSIESNINNNSSANTLSTPVNKKRTITKKISTSTVKQSPKVNKSATPKSSKPAKSEQKQESSGSMSKTWGSDVKQRIQEDQDIQEAERFGREQNDKQDAQIRRKITESIMGSPETQGLVKSKPHTETPKVSYTPNNKPTINKAGSSMNEDSYASERPETDEEEKERKTNKIIRKDVPNSYIS